MPHRTGLVSEPKTSSSVLGHAVGLMNPTVDSLGGITFSLWLSNLVTVVTFVAAVRQSCKQVS